MVGEYRNRGFDVEDAARGRWPAHPVNYGRNGRGDWCDIEFVDDGRERAGNVVTTADIPDEVESSHPDCADRPGRRWIRPGNHERSFEEDEVYVLAAVERQTHRILRLVLVAAPTIDALIDGSWWDSDDGGATATEIRRRPWTRILDELDGSVEPHWVDIGGRLADDPTGVGEFTGGVWNDARLPGRRPRDGRFR